MITKEHISNMDVTNITYFIITGGRLCFFPFLTFMNFTSLSYFEKFSPGHIAAEHSKFIKVLLSEACILLQPPHNDNLISSTHSAGSVC